MRYKRGFTLIELLVVISLIALLVGMLLPPAARARAMARRAVCLNSLKQMGTAVVSYATSNRMHVPRGSGDLDDDNFADDCLWFQALLLHLGCPVDLAPYRNATSPAERADALAAQDYSEVPLYRCPDSPDGPNYICYVNNGWTFASKDDGDGVQVTVPTSMYDFEKPARTVYLADNEDGVWRQMAPNDPRQDRKHLSVWHLDHLPFSNRDDKIYGRRVPRDRHVGGCNVLYVNGAAVWVGVDQMTVDLWRDNW